MLGILRRVGIFWFLEIWICGGFMFLILKFFALTDVWVWYWIWSSMPVWIFFALGILAFEVSGLLVFENIKITCAFLDCYTDRFVLGICNLGLNRILHLCLLAFWICWMPELESKGFVGDYKLLECWNSVVFAGWNYACLELGCFIVWTLASSGCSRLDWN